jgi:hypothetical protein
MKKELVSHIIYGLIDPNSKELRYVGYTSYPQKRYLEHIYKTASKSHKNNWIKSLLLNQQKPEMVILETYLSAEELPIAEIDTIEYYKFIGCNLTNGTIGGDGVHGYKHSNETIEKIKIHHIGKKRQTITKKRMSEAATGRISLRLGAKCSPESIKKMSEANQGKHIGEDNNFYGKTHSNAAKIKISEANKGRYIGKSWTLIDGKRVWIDK